MSVDLEAIIKRAHLIADFPVQNATQARLLARDDVPSLIAEIERLRGQIERLGALGDAMAEFMEAEDGASDLAEVEQHFDSGCDSCERVSAWRAHREAK